MDIRELVKLKKGLGGLEPPLNLGILLDREKAGKEHTGVVFTLKGILKVKWKFLKESTGHIYKGDKQDERSMTRFLEEAIKREEKQIVLKIDPEKIRETIDPEDLWRSVLRYISEGASNLGRNFQDVPAGCLNRVFSPGEIGHIHFYPELLGPKHIWAIERVLSRCDDRGEPNFARVDIERTPYYSPYSNEAIISVKRHIQLLEDLRSMFLEWVVLDDIEDRRSRKVPKLKVEDISTVVLPEDLKVELDRICRWAVFYLENGWWPLENEELAYTDLMNTGPFGLGGTDVRRLHKFDLERFMEFFTMDLTSTRKGDLPSSLVTLLLLFNRIDWKETSELVVKFNLGSGARKFHEGFQQHILQASERLPDSVQEEDEKGREDLTDLETYTIDPVDAKDFDDAVSISRNGANTIVWVHIADVSHYVRPGDLIDAEARYRSTSVYLPTRVIPMLPPKLSEDLCSLRENVKRLALSTRMVFNDKFELLEWDHIQSVIKVDRNLNYEQVDNWIEEGREPFLSLHRISTALEVSGSRLKINTPEKKIRFTSGSSIDVTLKRPTRSTKMIEELMVATNECAARYLEERGIPAPFRVHPLPDKTSAEKFNAACEALGLEVRIEPDWGSETQDEKEKGSDMMLSALLSGGKISFGAASSAVSVEKGSERSELHPTSREAMEKAVISYNVALSEIMEHNDETIRDMLNLRLLRTLSRAFYSVDNIGHFGLRSMSYLHFTSPIRRYPDILVHRSVKACLQEENKGPDVGWFAPKEEEIDEQMEHTNDMTDSAEEWERDMIDVALATRVRMTSSILNGTHHGMVTSLTPASCFVLLDDGVTEGRILLRDLSPYPLTLDENESMVLVDLSGEASLDPKFAKEVARGEEDAVFMKLGSSIGCRISSVSIASGKIDLKYAGK